MNGLTDLLRRPGFWLAGGGIVAATGLGVGNGWIAGATVVTLLIAIAPCLAMCAMGLCMKGSECKKGAEDGGGCKAGSGNTPAQADPGSDRPA